MTDNALTPAEAMRLQEDLRHRVETRDRLGRVRVRFPYIPGLLAFREAPALVAALARLACNPDVLLCDGQGYAHPRRFGLACRVGLPASRRSASRKACS